MQAAATLFAEHGYDATGVAEICNTADVSKGAFYHHFASKNALFVALLESWLADLDTRLESIVLEETPFPETLSSMAKMIDEIFLRYRDQILILFEFWMQASRDLEVWNAVIAPFQRYESYFAKMIEKGIQEGSLADMDPQAGARTLISLAVGLLLQGMLLSRSSAGSSSLNGFGGGKPAQKSISILLDGFKRLK